MFFSNCIWWYFVMDTERIELFESVETYEWNKRIYFCICSWSICFIFNRLESRSQFRQEHLLLKHQILITLKKHRLLIRLENTIQGCTRKGYFWMVVLFFYSLLHISLILKLSIWLINFGLTLVLFGQFSGLCSDGSHN